MAPRKKTTTPNEPPRRSRRLQGQDAEVVEEVNADVGSSAPPPPAVQTTTTAARRGRPKKETTTAKSAGVKKSATENGKGGKKTKAGRKAKGKGKVDGKDAQNSTASKHGLDEQGEDSVESPPKRHKSKAEGEERVGQEANDVETEVQANDKPKEPEDFCGQLPQLLQACEDRLKEATESDGAAAQDLEFDTDDDGRLPEETVWRAIASVTEAISLNSSSTTFSLIDHAVWALHSSEGADVTALPAEVARPGSEAFIVRTDGTHTSLFILRRENAGAFTLQHYDTAKNYDRHVRDKNAYAALITGYLAGPGQWVRNNEVITVSSQRRHPGRQASGWECGYYVTVYSWASALGLDFSAFRNVGAGRKGERFRTQVVQLVRLALHGVVDTAMIEAFLKCYGFVPADSQIRADRQFDHTHAFLTEKQYVEYVSRRRLEQELPRAADTLSMTAPPLETILDTLNATNRRRESLRIDAGDLLVEYIDARATPPPRDTRDTQQQSSPNTEQKLRAAGIDPAEIAAQQDLLRASQANMGIRLGDAADPRSPSRTLRGDTDAPHIDRQSSARNSRGSKSDFPTERPVQRTPNQGRSGPTPSDTNRNQADLGDPEQPQPQTTQESTTHTPAQPPTAPANEQILGLIEEWNAQNRREETTRVSSSRREDDTTRLPSPLREAMRRRAAQYEEQRTATAREFVAFGEELGARHADTIPGMPAADEGDSVRGMERGGANSGLLPGLMLREETGGQQQGGTRDPAPAGQGQQATATNDVQEDDEVVSPAASVGSPTAPAP